jgi:hypothetical protein
MSSRPPGGRPWTWILHRHLLVGLPAIGRTSQAARMASRRSGAGAAAKARPAARVALLGRLDVRPRVAMQILRHSKVALTMEICTEVPSAATRAALRKLGEWLGR